MSEAVLQKDAGVLDAREDEGQSHVLNRIRDALRAFGLAR